EHLKIGGLVIINDSKAPPLTWKVCRIIGVFLGGTGVVLVKRQWKFLADMLSCYPFTSQLKPSLA
ncbi:hypothetical protein J6590_092934, partial [Homalodisca vitripennis]